MKSELVYFFIVSFLLTLWGFSQGAGADFVGKESSRYLSQAAIVGSLAANFESRSGDRNKIQALWISLSWDFAFVETVSLFFSGDYTAIQNGPGRGLGIRAPPLS